MRTRFLDAEALNTSYSSMPSDELLAVISLDAHEYEDEALEIARAELSARGFEESQFGERIRDLKARRYDELISASAPGNVKLPRWMYWVCLIESGLISYWILCDLAEKGRSRAIRDALPVIILGWVLKYVLYTLTMIVSRQ